MIGKMFNVSEQKGTNPVYNHIIGMQGNTARYSDTDFHTVAKEGYKENHVLFRCMREIIQACQQVEWSVCEKQKDGSIKTLENHPVFNTLQNPSPLFGKEQFLERVIAFYYLGGEAPIHKIAGTFGSAELYTYRPQDLSIEFSGEMTAPYKSILYKQQPIPSQDFMLFKTFNPLDDFDGLGHGMSLFSPAFKNGDLLNSFIDWNVSMLQNGGRPSGAFTNESTMDEPEYDRLKAQLDAQHTGTRNVGKMLLLEGGLKYQQMGQSPKDMDWKEGKESTIIDLCAAMGVDPILVGYNKYSTYNNKKEARKELYTSVAIPLLSNLASELTKFLVKEDGVYIKADFAHVPVLQEDEAEKYKRINESKFLSQNEKRVELGYETVEGLDIYGDVLVIGGVSYIPMNLVAVGEEPKKREEPKDNQKDYEY